MKHIVKILFCVILMIGLASALTTYYNPWTGKMDYVLSSNQIEGQFNSTAWNLSGTDVFLSITTNRVGIGTITPSSLLTTGMGSYVNEINLSNIFYLNSTSGNVGIGTASPDDLLEIEDSSFAVMRFDDTGQGEDWRIGATGDDFRFIYDTTSLFFIEQDGEVGIGDDSPDAKLEVVNGSGGGFMVSSSASGDGDIFIINSSGNVGIGTTAPTQELNVVGDLNVTGTIYGLGANISGNFVPYTGSTSVVALGGYDFSVNTSDLFVDVSSGNVGIGTTSPAVKLEVMGQTIINSSGNNNPLEVISSDPTSVIKFTDSANVGYAGIHSGSFTIGANALEDAGNVNVQLSTGRLGIGTIAPGYDLHVNGSTSVARFQGLTTTAANPIAYFDDSNSQVEIYGTSGVINIGPYNDHAIAFVGNAGAEEHMRIDNAGNVGIGTASPSSVSGWNKILEISDATDVALVLTEGSNSWEIAHAGTQLNFNYEGVNKFKSDSSGNIQLDGNINVDGTGDSYLMGNVGIGTGSPGAKLEVNGSILPTTNATHDLGSTSLAWDNIFVITINDLTPAWTIEDGSALQSIINIKNKDNKLDHESYPEKLRSKYYVLEMEKNHSRQVISGYNITDISSFITEEVCNETLIENETILECYNETIEYTETLNETLYKTEYYTTTAKKDVKVNESLNKLQQEQSVADELNVSLEKASLAEIVFTRDIGGTLTMVVEAIKELFVWNEEQDVEIQNLNNELTILRAENQVIKLELCEKDNTYSFCK